MAEIDFDQLGSYASVASDGPVGILLLQTAFNDLIIEKGDVFNAHL